MPVVGTRGTKEMEQADENVKEGWGDEEEKEACLVTSSIVDVGMRVGSADS
jgi:hypothetical protein